MVWKVKLTTKANKQFDTLEKKYQLPTLAALEALQDDPKIFGHGDIKKLKNKPGFRVRIGDVRIKFKINGDSIEVFFIGLRDDHTYKR